MDLEKNKDNEIKYLENKKQIGISYKNLIFIRQQLEINLSNVLFLIKELNKNLSVLKDSCLPKDIYDPIKKEIDKQLANVNIKAKRIKSSLVEISNNISKYEEEDFKC